jgi:hypothetical protein
VAKDQHLFFTSPTVTQDDHWLIFISERDGNPNLYAIERPKGGIYQLTRNKRGLMRSYAYPQGGLEGFGKASPCLDRIHNRVYWVEENHVFRLELDTGSQAVLCDLPEEWYTAYNHLSCDGRFLCVPCTDPLAFSDSMVDQWEQLRTVPIQMHDQNLVTRLYRIDTESGRKHIWAEVPFWVTHVQFDPLCNDRLIFNNEGEGQYSTPRIWCLEPDASFHPLFEQAKHMVCSHEVWSPTGKFITYHGWMWGLPFFGARTWEGELLHQIPMPSFAGGHVTPTLDGRGFTSDGIDGFITLATLTGEESKRLAAILMGLGGLFNRRRVKKLLPAVSSFFTQQVLGWLEQRLVSWRHLCKHDTATALKDQDAHVHASIVPNGRSIVFTSDRDGTCNVYEVLLGD